MLKDSPVVVKMDLSWYGSEKGKYKTHTEKSQLKISEPPTRSRSTNIVIV